MKCIFAPLAALALALPAAAQVPCSSQGVSATISPQFAAPGQVVVVTLTNGTNQVINLPSSCTYSAVYPGGACSGAPVFAPLCLAVITPIQPGQSHSMPWDQRDNAGQPVPAGTYSVSIRYWDAAFSVLSSCCPTMVITSGACSGPGTDYCSAMPNSTGSPAWICALGSAVVSDNNLTLAAQGLPANQFGYFITSSTQGFFAPPASDGFVCLGGNIGRYNASVGMGPAFSLLIDLTSIPVNPPQAVQPGDTWNFQAWYRDGSSNNFTNAVAVSFL